jgi:wobble nucleotide-excising tRNase
MNERIKQLAEQATSIVEMVGPQGYASSYANFDREKFAELIIKECANAIVNDSRLSDVRTARNGCVRTIKEHFGVEGA